MRGFYHDNDDVPPELFDVYQLTVSMRCGMDRMLLAFRMVRMQLLHTGTPGVAERL